MYAPGQPLQVAEPRELTSYKEGKMELLLKGGCTEWLNGQTCLKKFNTLVWVNFELQIGGSLPKGVKQ